MVVTADRLTIFYGKGNGDMEAGLGPNSFDKIEAEGHVRIDMDNRTAVSDKATYDGARRVLVLSGPGTKMVSGKDEISGSKITLYRETGQVVITGSGDSQVKATIHSSERGLN